MAVSQKEHQDGWEKILKGLLRFAGTVGIYLIIDFLLLSGRAFLSCKLKVLTTNGFGEADLIFDILKKSFDAITLILFFSFFLMELATVGEMVFSVYLDFKLAIKRHSALYTARVADLPKSVEKSLIDTSVENQDKTIQEPVTA